MSISTGIFQHFVILSLQAFIIVMVSLKFLFKAAHIKTVQNASPAPVTSLISGTGIAFDEKSLFFI
jgi:hypothetical protein